jgi:hypothetical protein
VKEFGLGDAALFGGEGLEGFEDFRSEVVARGGGGCGRVEHFGGFGGFAVAKLGGALASVVNGDAASGDGEKGAGGFGVFKHRWVPAQAEEQLLQSVVGIFGIGAKCEKHRAHGLGVVFPYALELRGIGGREDESRLVGWRHV